MKAQIKHYFYRYTFNGLIKKSLRWLKFNNVERKKNTDGLRMRKIISDIE